MKILVFLTLFFNTNLGYAKLNCMNLFDQTDFKTDLQSVVFSDFGSLVRKLEKLSLQKVAISKVVKMDMPELKSDIKNQILFLGKVKNEAKYKNEFVKELARIHLANLAKSLNKPLDLQTHFRLSLKTVLILDRKVIEFDLQRKNVANRLTIFQQRSLKNYIANKIGDRLLVRAFPYIEEFFVEWSKAIKDPVFSVERIPVFSTLDLSLPQFNIFISNAISFIGIADHVTNPDRLGEMGSLRFAYHDLGHHVLSKGLLRFWNGVLTAQQRKKLMIKIRKNYLQARHELDAKSALTLDIIYFDFLHEDTNILPMFIKNIKQNGGVYKEPYTLDGRNVLAYSEIHGLAISAQYVYPKEIQQSNLDPSSLETLAVSFRPYWRLISNIWLKSYKSL